MLNATEVGVTTHFLDIGCGSGWASVLAAERGAKISGLDADEGLLFLLASAFPTATYALAISKTYPLKMTLFDVVFATNSVQYSGERIAALRELGRVWLPEGRIVAGLFGPPEKVAFSAIQKAIRDSLPEQPTGAGPYKLFAPGKLDGLFSEAGLNVLESGEADCPFKYPDFETYWQAQFSTGPLQSALRVVNEKQLNQRHATRLEYSALTMELFLFSRIFLNSWLRLCGLNM